MINSLTRTVGFKTRRNAAKTVILAGVAAYALFIGASAWAASVPWPGWISSTAHKAPPALSLIDPDKAEIFKKPTPGNAQDEIACLALNIYFEARGESDKGKIAVGHVVLNRVASKRFPGTICDVIRQGGQLRRNRCQFSWWCDGRSDKPQDKRQWQKSSELALNVYWGQVDDPTRGALWYHADYVKPSWRKAFVRGPKIGRHIFYSHPSRKTLVVSRLFE